MSEELKGPALPPCPLSRRITPEENICPDCPVNRDDKPRDAVLKCLGHLAEFELFSVTDWVLSSPLSAVHGVLMEVNTAIDHGDASLQPLRTSFAKPVSEIVSSLDMDVVRSNPEHVMLVGDSLFLTGGYEKALEFYHEYSRQMPDNPVGWNNCGLAASRSGDDAQAVEFYKKAVFLDREYSIAWFNLAKVLSRMKDYVRASKAFEKAVTLDPENISAWNNLGVMYSRQGRYQEAVRCYNRAVNIKDDYVWAWCNKGIALAALGFPRRARKAFIKALEIDPDFREAQEGLSTLATD